MLFVERGMYSIDYRSRLFPGLDQYCSSDRLVILVPYSCRGYTHVGGLVSATMIVAWLRQLERLR